MHTETDDTGPYEDQQRGARTLNPTRSRNPRPCWENARPTSLGGPRTLEPLGRTQNSEPYENRSP